MTITDQIKILNRKIMWNEAQYHLDRKAAKISALSSNNSDKYEYLTGEDLGLKPSTTEQTKFEYSPLGKIFNKGLDKDNQKEGLFKRLKTIENAQKIKLMVKIKKIMKIMKMRIKKQQQSNNIESQPINVFDYLKSLSQEEKDLMDEIEEANDDIVDSKLLFIDSNKKKLNFNTFNKPLNFISTIYNGEISLKKAEFKQRNLEKK